MAFAFTRTLDRAKGRLRSLAPQGQSDRGEVVNGRALTGKGVNNEYPK